MNEVNIKAQKLLDQIYESWKVIYTDDEGKHRLPTSRKAIHKSQIIVEELKALPLDDGYYLSEIEEIDDILKKSVERKFNFSIKIFIAMILWLGLVIIQNDIHKKPGFRIEGLTEEQLLNKKQKSLEVTKKNLQRDLEKFQAGYENYNKNYNWDEKKRKESWENLQERIGERKQYIKDITPLNAKQYRKYYIKDAVKARNRYLKTVIAYIIFYFLYLIASRRPNFLYWRKGSNKEVFSKIEDTIGNGIASAAFTSLYTVPSASLEKIHWSNGLITKRTSMFGANIFVFVLILFFLFCYYIFLAIIVPIRAIINYLRNYVLYF